MHELYEHQQQQQQQQLELQQYQHQHAEMAPLMSGAPEQEWFEERAQELQSNFDRSGAFLSFDPNNDYYDSQNNYYDNHHHHQYHHQYQYQYHYDGQDSSQSHDPTSTSPPLPQFYLSSSPLSFFASLFGFHGKSYQQQQQQQQPQQSVRRRRRRRSLLSSAVRPLVSSASRAQRMYGRGRSAAATAAAW